LGGTRLRAEEGAGEVAEEWDVGAAFLGPLRAACNCICVSWGGIGCISSGPRPGISVDDATQLWTRPPNSGPGHRTLDQATELWTRPPNSGPGHRTLDQATELWTTPPNFGPRHRTLDHATELWTTPPNSGPRHRTLDHATELWTKPPNSGPSHETLDQATKWVCRGCASDGVGEKGPIRMRLLDLELWRRSRPRQPMAWTRGMAWTQPTRKSGSARERQGAGPPQISRT
jgi:hypothetical protein